MRIINRRFCGLLSAKRQEMSENGLSSHLSFHHYLQNLHVGFLHAEATQAADVVDGLFHVLADDAIAAEEVAALLAHLVAEDTSFDGEGDLAGTRGLGAIADDACCHAKSVLKGVLDDAERLAHEVGDATARGAACTDGTTIC